MSVIDPNTKFEILAAAYERRYGEMAPGKDRPMSCSQSQSDRRANSARWTNWINQIAVIDLATRIAQLEQQLLAQTGRGDSCECRNNEKAENARLRQRVSELEAGISSSIGKLDGLIIKQEEVQELIHGAKDRESLLLECVWWCLDNGIQQASDLISWTRAGEPIAPPAHLAPLIAEALDRAAGTAACADADGSCEIGGPFSDGAGG